MKPTLQEENRREIDKKDLRIGLEGHLRSQEQLPEAAALTRGGRTVLPEEKNLQAVLAGK